MKEIFCKLSNFNKKFIICTFIVVLSALCFVACSEKDNSLNMNYYTLITSSYTTIKESGSVKTVSTDFIGSEKFFRQYDKITVNFSSEWLYNFNIEKFSFDVTTNADCELQFKITLTNLKNGEITSSLNVKNKQFTILRSYTANSIITDTVSVRDIIEASASNTCLIFEVENTEVYLTNGQINNFAFSLNNIKLFGEPVYS